MKGIHPKMNRAVACAFVAALLAGGCRSTSSGANNPFFAPNRVAPPSTRVLAPGQAQPYYQGDPLPVMQSATAPATNTSLVSESAAARSATGKTLAWNNPVAGASAAPASARPTSAAAPWDVNPQAPKPIAFTNEPAVSVPADGDSLRFALPKSAMPQSVLPVAAAPSNIQPIQIVPDSSNQGVALASYSAPATSGLMPVTTAPTLSPTPAAASPWRTPLVTAAAPLPLGYAAQPSLASPAVVQPAYSLAQSPVVMPAKAMAVQLRAVPSPPPQPGDPLPRVRIPGYEVPETTTDGFRPRSSMR